MSIKTRRLKTSYCFETTLCPSPAWWLLRGVQTRSHPELGRQTPPRQWYYVSRPGRVGRCQACQAHKVTPLHHHNPQRGVSTSPVSTPLRSCEHRLTRGGAAR